MALRMRWVSKQFQTIARGLVFAGLCASLPAQTLAHRNWAGSGIAIAPWWQGAEFYQVDPISFQDSDDDGFGDLPGLIDRLDYLASLSVDALLLSPFQLSTGTQPFDPAYGSEGDFARLIAEATIRHLRVIVDFPLGSQSTEAELLEEARFWLIRGVAGLRLTGTGIRTEGTIRALRRLCGSFAGQRVLLLAPSVQGEEESTPQVYASVAYFSGAHARRARRSRSRTARAGSAEAAEAPLLRIDERSSLLSAVTPAGLRLLLGSTASISSAKETLLAATDTSEHPRSFARAGGSAAEQNAVARVLATALLLGAHDPLLLFGQELGMASGTAPAPMQWGGSPSFTSGIPWIEMGPNAATANVALEDGQADSLLSWYQRLGVLRRGNPALHSGSLTLLQGQNPDVVAWVRRAQAGEAAAPVLVVANTSSRAAVVSFTGELRRAGVRVTGRGLHTLASTFGAEAAADPNGLRLPAYAVYVGEVRAQPGLETVTLPPRSRRSGR